MNKVPETEQGFIDAVHAKEAELYARFDEFIKKRLDNVDGLVYHVMCLDGESFLLAEVMGWDWGEMADMTSKLHLDGASAHEVFVNGLFDKAWEANGLDKELLQ